jgi:hypothetical protein
MEVNMKGCATASDVIDSNRLMVQKIDAIKTFLLPMLHFMLLNGDASVTQLKDMVQNSRGAVDQALKVKVMIGRTSA